MGQNRSQMATTYGEAYCGSSASLVKHSVTYTYVAVPCQFIATLNFDLALCFNFAGIAAARFFLGLVESIIGPVFVIVTSNWWTRPEQAFRTAFWLGGTPVRVIYSACFHAASLNLTIYRLEISLVVSSRTALAQVRS